MTTIRKPKSAAMQYQAMQNAVRQELQPVATAHRASRARIVADWTNKPEFQAQAKVGPKQIMVQVTIANRGARVQRSNLTIGGLWRMLDQTGSKPHKIRARNPKGRLLFLAGEYQARTGANPARYGGPGQVVGGEWTSPQEVNHSGFPARGFSKAINQDLKGTFDSAVDRGMRKARGQMQ